MGNIICVKIVARGKIYADNVAHIKISNKLTPSINYFLNSHMFNGKLIFLISFCFIFFKYFLNNNLGLIYVKKSLKIPKGGNQNPYIEEEHTTRWPTEKRTKGQTTIYKTYT